MIYKPVQLLKHSLNMRKQKIVRFKILKILGGAYESNKDKL